MVVVTTRKTLVSAFLFMGDVDDRRHNTICSLVSRVTDEDLLRDVGPAFFVQYGDGMLDVAPCTSLHPWFPV